MNNINLIILYWARKLALALSGVGILTAWLVPYTKACGIFTHIIFLTLITCEWAEKTYIKSKNNGEANE